MNRWQRFLCFVLDWHTCNVQGFDGLSFVSHCKRCGQRCLQDSNGGWFVARRQE